MESVHIKFEFTVKSSRVSTERNVKYFKVHCVFFVVESIMLKQILFARAKRSLNDAFLFAKPKVKVRVNGGVVKGCLESLPNGNKFLRFSGIPYALPPINELKFRAPQKLLKFDTDEIDCTREGNACFHKSTIKRKLIGSEDCLNLNVYTPADNDSSKKKAVMVFIHGGGFMMDSNSVDLY